MRMVVLDGYTENPEGHHRKANIEKMEDGVIIINNSHLL